MLGKWFKDTDVPLGWEISALGDVANITMGQSPPGSSYNEEGLGIPLLNGPAQYGRRHPVKEQWTTDPSKLCQAGDVLFCVRGSTTGRMNVADGTYCIGRGVAAIRGRDSTAITRYIERILRIMAEEILAEAKGGGSTFPNVTSTRLSEIQFFLPPLSDQRRIAEVLDTVDAAIQQTEEVIAKLKQVKAGLLQDLLTRGLDANGRLRDPDRHPEQFKDSPLGRIPKGWEALPIKKLVQVPVTYGIVQPGPDLPDGVPYVRSGDTAATELHPNMLRRTSESIASSYSRSRVSAGEIITTIRATVGRTHQVPELLDGANLGRGVARIAPIADVNSRFFYWAMNSAYMQKQFDLYSKGTTYSEITLDKLGDLLLAVPVDKKEQRNIAYTLDLHLNRIHAERAFRSKLQHLKQGMMQDLLTGRVRVPEAEEIAEETLSAATV